MKYVVARFPPALFEATWNMQCANMLAVPDFVFRLLGEVPIPEEQLRVRKVLGRQCPMQLILRICFKGGYHRLLFYTKGYMA